MQDTASDFSSPWEIVFKGVVCSFVCLFFLLFVMKARIVKYFFY